MAGDETIWVNGYEWRDATNATTPGFIYTEREIRAAGGDPRKLAANAAKSTFPQQISSTTRPRELHQQETPRPLPPRPPNQGVIYL